MRSARPPLFAAAAAGLLLPSLLCSLSLLLLLARAASAAPVAPVLTHAEAQAAFRATTDACLREDSQACIEGYQRLIDAGWGAAAVEYNLGTAYLKQGKLGPGVLHLERALRLDPSDEDARANLERAHRQRVDKLVGAPQETGGEEPFASRVVSNTSGDRWGLAFLITWGLGALAVVLRRLLRPGPKRAAVLVAGLLLVAVSLPCGAVTALHAWVREGARDAVVVAPSVPVREGPKDSFKAPFEIHEGLKVRLLGQEGSFRHVRLANGLQGWVPAASVVEISPAG